MTIVHNVAADRRSAALVPIAMVATNLVSYALLLLAARILSKPAYGELLSLLALLLVASVPSLAIQTIVARHAASTGAPRGLMVRATVAVSAAATLALTTAAPLLHAFLHLSGAIGLFAIVASVPGSTWLGALQGSAQGEQRYAALAALTAATVGGRSLVAILGLAAGRSTSWCLVGAAVGVSLVAAAAGRWAPRGEQHGPGEPHLRPVVTEIAHAAHGHGAFLLLLGLDVLLARHALSEENAGIYAAGSVVTRATLWLPQAVAVLLFASLADIGRHRRAYVRAVVLVLAIGASLVIGTFMLGRLAVTVVAGARFHTLDASIWLFAVLGTALAVIQLSVVAGLALRRPGRIAVIWAVAAADVLLVLGFRPREPMALAAGLATTAVLGAVASVAIALARNVDVLADQPVVAAGQDPGRNPGASPAPNRFTSPD